MLQFLVGMVVGGALLAGMGFDMTPDDAKLTTSRLDDAGKACARAAEREFLQPVEGEYSDDFGDVSGGEMPAVLAPGPIPAETLPSVEAPDNEDAPLANPNDRLAEIKKRVEQLIKDSR